MSELIHSLSKLPLPVLAGCIVGFALAVICILSLFISNKEREKARRDGAWKEYLRFKASRGELTDKEGNIIPPEQVS